MSDVLVVVPCGLSKIGDREPESGPVTAAEAHTGTPFRLHRQYAERFGDAWVVLNAKDGFIAPDFMIPEPYEVSFKHLATSPIAFDRLRQQVREQQLGRYPVIVSLGGKEYCAAIAVGLADIATFAAPRVAASGTALRQGGGVAHGRGCGVLPAGS